MKKGFILFFIGLVAVIFLVGCPGPQPKVQLSITTTSPIELSEHDTQTIDVFTLPEDATVEFTSENPSVASVDSSTGEVTALASGTSTIKVKASASGHQPVEKTIVVNVSEFEITITYSPNPMTLTAGGQDGSINVNVPFESSISLFSVANCTSNCVQLNEIPLLMGDSFSVVPVSAGTGVITVSATATVGSGEQTKSYYKVANIEVTVQ